MEISTKDDGGYYERRTTRLAGSVSSQTAPTGHHNDPRLVRFPQGTAPKSEEDMKRSFVYKTITSVGVGIIALLFWGSLFPITSDRSGITPFTMSIGIVGLAMAIISLIEPWAASKRQRYWYGEVPQGEVYEVGISNGGDYVVIEGYNRAGLIAHQRHRVDFTKIDPVQVGDYVDMRPWSIRLED